MISILYICMYAYINKNNEYARKRALKDKHKILLFEQWNY